MYVIYVRDLVAVGLLKHFSELNWLNKLFRVLKRFKTRETMFTSRVLPNGSLDFINFINFINFADFINFIETCKFACWPSN